MYINFLSQLRFLAGVYLGWGVGANDTANIFGPAVAAHVIKYRSAVILAAVFVLAGAVIEGPALMENVGGIAGKEFVVSAPGSVNLAFISSFSAAFAITVLTYLSIPASTSQASIGSIMGVGIALQGAASAQWESFFRMFIVWVINPFATIIVVFILYRLLAPVVNYLMHANIIIYNRIFQVLLVMGGAYGAYALGASHAAVCTAPFFMSGVFGDPGTSRAAYFAAAAGGAGMTLGVITYSKKVMGTIGRKITVLDPFSAFISIIGTGLTVHFCKMIGVPVSTSQAMVGAVTGVGLIKGVNMVNFKSLRSIFAGWVATPIFGAVFCYILIHLFLL